MLSRDKAKNITPEQNCASLERFEVYRKWLLKEVLRTHERNPIVIWPINIVEPNYRDRLQPYVADHHTWTATTVANLVSQTPEGRAALV